MVFEELIDRLVEQEVVIVVLLHLNRLKLSVLPDYSYRPPLLVRSLLVLNVIL